MTKAQGFDSKILHFASLKLKPVLIVRDTREIVFITGDKMARGVE